MLKLSFEGDSVAELKEQMSNTLAELEGGSTPVSAATGSKAKGAAVKKAVAKTTLEDVQAAMTGSTATREQKVALLADYNVAKVSELEESEFDKFIGELKAI